MLTLVEKILFIVATLVSLYFTYRGVARIMDLINSGQGKIDWSLAYKRIGDLILKGGIVPTCFSFQAMAKHFAWTHRLGLPLVLVDQSCRSYLRLHWFQTFR